jgi:glycosyltransferase involved in cell wall biosynthesis
MIEHALAHGRAVKKEETQLETSTASHHVPRPYITLLTGGGDRPYVFGLATELLEKGARLDLIGSDNLDLPEFRNKPGLNFLNLRGDQRSEANLRTKILRVLTYYAKLFRYAATAKPKIFHILWHNKIEVFDRTLLLLYYKLLGKKLVLTAHNVNAGKRDREDTLVNRLTLRAQYRLVDHIFVHTEKMKAELMGEFGTRESRISVIPFGINNSVPDTGISSREAKERLNISPAKKVILFYGRITPYKGLEYLVSALQKHIACRQEYVLIIAGRPELGAEEYWNQLRDRIYEDVQDGRIRFRAEHIPDDETEIYFKAADALVLPYTHIYQSGVLFLGFSFGLPVLAADVGALKDEIIEGETGFVFRPSDPVSLAAAIERYFASDIYEDLDRRRTGIRDRAKELHSWDVVGRVTVRVYGDLLRRNSRADSRIAVPRSTSSE